MEVGIAARVCPMGNNYYRPARYLMGICYVWVCVPWVIRHFLVVEFLTIRGRERILFASFTGETRNDYVIEKRKEKGVQEAAVPGIEPVG